MAAAADCRASRSWGSAAAAKEGQAAAKEGHKITQRESSLGWRPACIEEERNSRTGVVRRAGGARETPCERPGTGRGRCRETDLGVRWPSV
ncbi:hypothetical protein GCM10010306_089270 [Streptomyces umbrinus]|nr:hypothetical protein GCM10010306_089270 [Streptomyces umbrinus]